MTTQIRTFNPAEFDPKTNGGQTEDVAQKKSVNKKYRTTGNSTRDQVRKMLFEAFVADTNEDEAASMVDLLEAKIFELVKDPKSKQYRDKTRALQNKLKGARFADNRAKLVSGDMTVDEACSDEFLLLKAQATGPKSGMPQRPMGGVPARPRGPHGAIVRPQSQRGPIRPPVGLGRPPVPQRAPVAALPK